MHRYQLEHAIRAACRMLRRDQFIIAGSRSILGSFHEDELPEQTIEQRDKALVILSGN